MCEFCTEYEKVKGKYELSVSLNIRKRSLNPASDLSVDYSQYTIGEDKIRYCPKCGRRINK